jgi:uncharacterized alpha-E superfamily protein
MSETAIEVLMERIENLAKLVEVNHTQNTESRKDNKEEHEKILNQVLLTNGKVRSLQIWKASIVGAISIITIVASYTISDFLATKREFSANEKQQALNMERIVHLEKELDALKR